MLSKIFAKIVRLVRVATIYRMSKDPWYVTAFWRNFYKHKKRTHDNTFWLGVNAVKPPTDLWVYQEIIYETKPDVIIETGTKYGGTTYYLATLCDLMGRGRVVSVDIKEYERRKHPRVTYVTGSSIDDGIITKMQNIIKANERVMVILDSDHHFEFVNEEMERYAPLVTSGNYLIVEDSCVNGHPTYEDFGPGPMESIERFLERHPEFRSDRSREKYWLTYNPKGYLLKT